MVFGLPRSTAPKQPKRKAKRKRTDAKPFLDVAIEGLAAGHEHASEMGVYRHTGREVNGRGVWASVGHHAAYLFYSAMGSWCARLPYYLVHRSASVLGAWHTLGHSRTDAPTQSLT